MHTILDLALSAIGILLVGVPLYYLYVQWAAWIEVKASPREEMGFCPKHGPIRKAHMIKFLDNEICPTCFHDSHKRAENGL